MIFKNLIKNNFYEDRSRCPSITYETKKKKVDSHCLYNFYCYIQFKVYRRHAIGVDERELTYPFLLHTSLFLLWSNEHYFFCFCIDYHPSEVTHEQTKNIVKCEVNYSQEQEFH